MKYRIVGSFQISYILHKAWRYENKNYENLKHARILETLILTILTRGSSDQAMALCQYFHPSDGLPYPSGPLSASVSNKRCQ